MSASTLLGATPATLALVPGADRVAQLGSKIELAADQTGTATYVLGVGSNEGGGWLPGRLQLYSYLNGAVEGKLLETLPPGSVADTTLFCNAAPGVSQRIGYVTGTGAPQVVAVSDINATSRVLLSITGTTVLGALAAADAAPITSPLTPVIAAGQFTVTLPANVTYLYQVIG